MTLDYKLILPLTLLLASLVRHARSEWCRSDVCEYTFVLSRSQTMTYRHGSTVLKVALNGSALQTVSNSFHRAEHNSFIGTFVDPAEVITADGFPREVITVNDQFPGPTIEVNLGAQVVVHVENELGLEPTSLHWHGLHMRNSPWMDGPSYVTQCPVLPHQKFTYRFEADTVGTHFYHSHYHGQRIDGLFGMIIVHESAPRLPYHEILLTDWIHTDAGFLHTQNPYAIGKSGSGDAETFYLDREYMADNNELSALTFVSALINGRGRPQDGRPFPLTEFSVTPGRTYRFRLAHTGPEYSFEVSIDNHPLRVVASDGQEISALDVDSLMVHPGETFDFEVEFKQSSAGSYWLRADTLRVGTGHNPIPDGREQGVKAIIRYQGITAGALDDPATSPRTCSDTSICRVFNCPFKEYRVGAGKECIALVDARSLMEQSAENDVYGLHDNDVVEYFFNFGFTIGSSINSRKFLEPRTSLSHPEYENYIKPCDEDMCNLQGCLCTNMPELPYNKTIQLVISNYQDFDFIAHHAVHMHGHNFAVLAMGFAEQNATTGYWNGPNPDVMCMGPGENPALCTQPRWNGQQPTLNFENPPIKDNVIIPARGYTVIRFRSDNPGYWSFHCHQELHFIEGMRMVLNEAPEHHRPVPEGFPVCGDFTWTEEQYTDYHARPERSLPPTLVTEPEQPVRTTQGTSAPRQECPPGDGGSDDEPHTLRLTVRTAIGTAFGLVILGAVLTMVPTCVLLICRKVPKQA